MRKLLSNIRRKQVPRTIEIRRAGGIQAAELSAIAFAAKRYWDYPEEWIQLWADELTVSEAYIEANWVYSASDAGRTVGWFAVRQEEKEHWLDYCWVTPEAAGQGVGRQLVQRAFALAAELRSRALKVIADPNAEEFYGKLGFERIGYCPSVPVGRLLPVLKATVDDRGEPE